MSMTSFIEKKNESEMKGFPWKDDVLGDLRARVLLMKEHEYSRDSGYYERIMYKQIAFCAEAEKVNKSMRMK